LLRIVDPQRHSATHPGFDNHTLRSRIVPIEHRPQRTQHARHGRQRTDTGNLVRPLAQQPTHRQCQLVRGDPRISAHPPVTQQLGTRSPAGVDTELDIRVSHVDCEQHKILSNPACSGYDVLLSKSESSAARDGSTPCSNTRFSPSTKITRGWWEAAAALSICPYANRITRSPGCTRCAAAPL